MSPLLSLVSNMRGSSGFSVQSDEEIARLTVSEALEPHEMLLHLLRRGEVDQKRAVLRRIPDYITLRSDLTSFKGIVGVLSSLITSEDTPGEIRQESVDAMHRLCARGLLHVEILNSSVLPLCVKLAARDSSATPALRDGVARVLTRVLSVVDVDAVQRDIVPLALSLSDASEVDNAREDRVRGTRLLGSLASLSRLPADVLRGSVFSRMLDLCQDTSGHVREAAASQLPALLSLASTMSSETLDNVVEELTELLGDEEPAVRGSDDETIRNRQPVMIHPLCFPHR